MTTMRRLRVTWDGIGGLPGLSTFYYGVATPNVSDCKTFFTAVAGLFPGSLTWTIPNSGDELDDATGALTGAWTGTGGGTVSGAGGALTYAAGTGAIVNWNTGIIHNGRRVRGRTFMAPINGNAYSTSGTVVSSSQAALQAAATAFAASGVAKGIWSKGTTPGGGLYAAISSATVPSRVTSLRSRRF